MRPRAELAVPKTEDKQDKLKTQDSVQPFYPSGKRYQEDAKVALISDMRSPTLEATSRSVAPCSTYSWKLSRMSRNFSGYSEASAANPMPAQTSPAGRLPRSKSNAPTPTLPAINALFQFSMGLSL